ncbi:ATP-binding protein [Streptomyces flaveolus]|uniref:ATP-binding protein n=1 Tax=Streptomyces flaveolus TaxID=67297 RepID=UPI0033EC48F1
MTAIGTVKSGAPAPGEGGRRLRVRHRAVLTLPSRAELVASVRVFTAGVLHRWGIGGEEQDTAVLIVDELAANAVLHGRADMALLLALDGGTLRITMADSGARARAEAPDVPPDEHGRGLGIVGRLADHAEIRPGGSGCRVYVRLRVTPSYATVGEPSLAA